MLATISLAAFFMSAPTDMTAGPCPLAETYYAEGEHSQAIGELNRCISEDGLSPYEKACAVLNRAKNYLALGADDKAAGDRDSAIGEDPTLQQPEKAAACLQADAALAQELLQLESY